MKEYRSIRDRNALRGLLGCLGGFLVAAPAFALPQASFYGTTTLSYDPKTIVAETWVVDNSGNLSFNSWSENFLYGRLYGNNTGYMYGGQYEQEWPYTTNFSFCAFSTAGTVTCSTANVSPTSSGAAAYVWWRDYVVSGSNSSVWKATVWHGGYPYDVGPWTLVGTMAYEVMPYELTSGSTTAMVQANWEHVRYVPGSGGYGNWFSNMSPNNYCDGSMCGHTSDDVDGGAMGHGWISN